MVVVFSTGGTEPFDSSVMSLSRRTSDSADDRVTSLTRDLLEEPAPDLVLAEHGGGGSAGNAAAELMTGRAVLAGAVAAVRNCAFSKGFDSLVLDANETESPTGELHQNGLVETTDFVLAAAVS